MVQTWVLECEEQFAFDNQGNRMLLDWHDITLRKNIDIKISIGTANLKKTLKKRDSCRCLFWSHVGVSLFLVTSKIRLSKYYFPGIRFVEDRFVSYTWRLKESTSPVKIQYILNTRFMSSKYFYSIKREYTLSSLIGGFPEHCITELNGM